MGYLLPIEPYQQMNDQLKSIRKNRQVDSVEKPFPVYLEEKYEQATSNQNRSSNIDRNTLFRPDVRGEIPLITGKGRNVDEVV
jgi:hypothetical protein